MLQSIALVLFLSTLLYLPSSLRTPFHSKGEPREALVAQSMLLTGNWILPERFGEEFATKPPMTHWLMSVVSLPIGSVTEFSARAPSVLLSVGFLSFLFIFLASYRGIREAGTATAILALSGLWMRSSVIARVDLSLSVFLASALLLIFTIGAKPRSHKAAWPTLWLLLAAATLTKGPVALVLPAIISSIFLYCRSYSLLKIFKTLFIMLVVPAAISSLWYLLAYLLKGDEFLSVVINENFARFTGNMTEKVTPHANSIVYLPSTLLLGFLPTTLFVVPLLKRYIQDSSLLKEDRFKKLKANIKEADPLLSFSLLVVVSFLVFFSIPLSKRAEYLLPIYPFLSILAAALMHSHSTVVMQYLAWSARKLAQGLLVLSALLGLVVLLGYSLQTFLPEKIQLQIALTLNALKAFTMLEFMGLAVLIVCSVLFLKTQASLSEQKNALGGVALYYLTLVVIVGVLLPVFARQVSPKYFASEVQSGISDNETLFVTDEMYALNFYLKGKLIPISPDSLAQRAGSLVIAYEDECLEQSEAQILLWSQPLRRHNSSKICLMKMPDDQNPVDLGLLANPL